MTMTPEQLLVRMQKLQSITGSLPQMVHQAARSSLTNVRAPGVRIGVSKRQQSTRVLVRSSNAKIPAAAVAKAIKPQVRKAVGEQIRRVLSA